MGPSIVWLAADLLQNLGGLALLALCVALVVYHFKLSDRLARLEARMARLEAPQDPQRTDTAMPYPGRAAHPAAATPDASAPRAGTAATAAAAVPAAARPLLPAPPPGLPPSAAVARRAPAAAAHPSGIEPASGWAASLLGGFLAGGNWLVRGGVLVLFLGVGFLLKFAADNALLPVPLRLLGVGLGGVALVGIGIRLITRRRAYALALQGAGVGLIYLTLYAAFRLYALLPASAAFVLMLGTVLAAGWLALRQDALVLAVLGALGGFAAPVLASTGSGSHVMLFSYYALLNMGVLGLSLLRAWRPLNLLGFIATFGLSALWGARFYVPAHLASVEPFLVLFFAMYLAIAIAYASLRSIRLEDPVDSTLVFGTPLVAFALQSQLLGDSAYGLAASALVLALVYAGSALFLHRRGGDGLGLLKEAFMALAVGFATVGIALAFDARWTSASWALEGAALVWLGWRQRRMLARLAGAALQLLAGGAWAWHALDHGGWDAGYWLGTLMIAVAGLLSGAVLAGPAPGSRGPRAADEGVLSLALGLWGLAWWFAGGTLEVADLFERPARFGAALIFYAASALALERGGRRLPWRLARRAGLLLPALLWLCFLASFAIAVADAVFLSSTGFAPQRLLDTHPLASLAALGWPVALAAAAALLRFEDAERGTLLAAMHVLLLWLLAGLAAWELAWCFQRLLPEVTTWRRLAWPLAPAGLAALVAWAVRRAQQGRAGWPVSQREALYLLPGAAPMAGLGLLGVVLLSIAHPGGSWPVAYVVLLDPTDLMMLAIIGAGAAWLRVSSRYLAPEALLAARGALVAAAFVWLNGALLRALHFWAGVPWRFDAMFDSNLVQASLSVLWAVTGLLTMLGASRAGSRALWSTGAALMAVVVLKLMLVDLAGSATIARIVSFISVGLLLMLVGYLAPVPPRGTPRPDAHGRRA